MAADATSAIWGHVRLPRPGGITGPTRGAELAPSPLSSGASHDGLHVLTHLIPVEESARISQILGSLPPALARGQAPESPTLQAPAPRRPTKRPPRITAAPPPRPDDVPASRPSHHRRPLEALEPNTSLGAPGRQGKPPTDGKGPKSLLPRPSRLPPPPRGPENEAPGAPHPQLPSLRKGAGAPMRAQSPAVVRPQALTGAGPRPAGADARAVESPGPRATRQGIREPRDPFARAGAGGGRRAGPLAPVASALPALESVPGLPSPSRDRPATHASATRPAAYEARRAQAAQEKADAVEAALTRRLVALPNALLPGEAWHGAMSGDTASHGTSGPTNVLGGTESSLSSDLPPEAASALATVRASTTRTVAVAEALEAASSIDGPLAGLLRRAALELRRSCMAAHAAAASAGAAFRDIAGAAEGWRADARRESDRAAFLEGELQALQEEVRRGDRASRPSQPLRGTAGPKGSAGPRGLRASGEGVTVTVSVALSGRATVSGVQGPSAAPAGQMNASQSAAGVERGGWRGDTGEGGGTTGEPWAGLEGSAPSPESHGSNTGVVCREDMRGSWGKGPGGHGEGRCMRVGARRSECAGEGAEENGACPDGPAPGVGASRAEWRESLALGPRGSAAVDRDPRVSASTEASVSWGVTLPSRPTLLRPLGMPWLRVSRVGDPQRHGAPEASDETSGPVAGVEERHGGLPGGAGLESQRGDGGTESPAAASRSQDDRAEGASVAVLGGADAQRASGAVLLPHALPPSTPTPPHPSRDGGASWAGPAEEEARSPPPALVHACLPGQPSDLVVLASPVPRHEPLAVHAAALPIVAKGSGGGARKARAARSSVPAGVSPAQPGGTPGHTPRRPGLARSRSCKASVLGVGAMAVAGVGVGTPRPARSVSAGGPDDWREFFDDGNAAHCTGDSPPCTVVARLFGDGGEGVAASAAPALRAASRGESGGEPCAPRERAVRFNDRVEVRIRTATGPLPSDTGDSDGASQSEWALPIGSLDGTLRRGRPSDEEAEDGPGGGEDETPSVAEIETIAEGADAEQLVRPGSGGDGAAWGPSAPESPEPGSPCKAARGARVRRGPVGAGTTHGPATDAVTLRQGLAGAPSDWRQFLGSPDSGLGADEFDFPEMGSVRGPLLGATDGTASPAH